MAIEVIPLSRLQSEAPGVLAKCCDSGTPVVVELPDHRLVSIQPIDADDEQGSLVSDLLEANQRFLDLVKRSATAPRKPFPRNG